MTRQTLLAIATFATALFLLAACQRPSTGVFVELTGRIFVFNYRVATATYLVTLRRVAAIPDGSVIEADFDNPAGGILTARQPIFATDETIAISSPPVSCIRKDHAYRIAIRIQDKAGGVLQAIETVATSDVDQSIMPGKPLVVGPLYTPNPDVFKPDGSEDDAPPHGCDG